jgi:hypothetical protein
MSSTSTAIRRMSAIAVSLSIGRKPHAPLEGATMTTIELDEGEKAALAAV